MPVVGSGEHTPLQQSPQPVHGSPSTLAVHVVEPGCGDVHTPSKLPETATQMPPQHSESCAHALLSATHQLALPHVPLQKAPQHSLLLVHGLPVVLQDGSSAVHVCELEQLPLQHSEDIEHAAPSATQVLAHTPNMQLTEQQSVLLEHDVPAIEQCVGSLAQWPCVSHRPEQHPAPQDCPYRLHTNAASRGASGPESTAASAGVSIATSAAASRRTRWSFF